MSFLSALKDTATSLFTGFTPTTLSFEESNITVATTALLATLHELNQVNVLGFGQQYANYVGQEWPWFQYWGEFDHSDVYTDTHDYPLVFGYNLQDFWHKLAERDYRQKLVERRHPTAGLQPQKPQHASPTAPTLIATAHLSAS